MWKNIAVSIILFITSINKIFCDFETLGGDNVVINKTDSETLFVSLGSYCAPASLARTFELRKAAFPFDWNISLDGEKLIELLRDGFLHFLNEEYLVPFGAAALLNTYYHIEFVHDGTWEGVQHAFYMPILQTKYKRRVERFRQLGEYAGKVYFIRAAYIHSTADPHRFYKVHDNIEITKAYAERLYEALKEVFPKLNFCLIIINNHEHEFIEETKRISDNILMIRASPDYTKPEIEENYRKFFESLQG